ncbi:MAG: hypothetical protein PHC31_10410 [Clostridia bacterium]|nr:hypothetical protein [Clostridia bacterium]MDD3972311.1 hypothetical protein [Clostridia bacterium]
MSFNSNGISEIVDASKDLFTHLAYGAGSVADNATSLVSEVDRADTPTMFSYSDRFELQFQIDETEGNGNTIREYGLAVSDVGDISSTLTYAPIEKNALVYVLIQLTTNFRSISL